jgi:hypothetical protein
MGGSGGAPITRPHFWRRWGANASYYAPYDNNARSWYKKVQEEVSFVNHAIVNPPVDRDRPLDEVKDVYMHVEEETDGGRGCVQPPANPGGSHASRPGASLLRRDL